MGFKWLKKILSFIILKIQALENMFQTARAITGGRREWLRILELAGSLPWLVNNVGFAEFYALLTVHLGIILVNNQLNAVIFSIRLFQFSTCFEQPRSHHQENQLYQYDIWYMSLWAGDRLVCRSGRNSFLSDPHCHLYNNNNNNIYLTAIGL